MAELREFFQGTSDEKMDESALLSNIAMIINKDILVDECSSHKKPKHFLWHSSETEVDGNVKLRFPLLEPADDDAEDFFLRQQYSEETPAAGGYEVPEQEMPSGSKKSNKKRKLTEKLENFNKKHKKLKDSKLKPISTKSKEVNLLNEFDNVEFEGYLHMSKMSFLKTFQFIRHLLSPSTFAGGVPPQTVFSLSLWKLTTDEHFEEIAKRFKITQSECETIISQFWHIISDKYESYIKWPNSQQSQELQLQGFQKHPDLKIFPKLFGILAIKRLDIFLASEDSEIPIILQIVCDVDQKVIDCFVELEQDYTFDETPMGQILALNENTMPKDCYLIGNKSFPLKPYLMKPFANPCFRKEHEFNVLLEPALKLAFDTLDIMAKRFNALYALEAKDLAEVRKILETICALHNLSIAIEDDYVERKREVVSFNWASDNSENCAVGSEQSVQGVQKRSDLVDVVVK